ncbi:PREDICTED: uncharacterized protein LOC108760048, partial [Trachymyrmex cornetzi]|uniref:uncharacterized protein LOC108760048 n=1 Tax=Trachymyrmex cornetzi TaxID=471704 RepID=UPI00084F5876
MGKSISLYIYVRVIDYLQRELANTSWELSILLPNHKFGKKGEEKGSDKACISINIEAGKFIDRLSEPLGQTNKKWFINLTDVNIPTEVSNLLQFGNNFNLPDSNNKVKQIREFIKDIESSTNKNSNNLALITQIRNIAIPEFHQFLHNNNNINNADKKINKMLRFTTNWCNNNKDIIFTRADKGNATVALELKFYNNKVLELLSDSETYAVVRKNPSSIIEKNLNDMLKKWHKKDYINDRELWRLRSSDALLPKAYALPKIHKEGVPFRIIVSSVNTALYHLAGFIQDIISKNIPSANSKVKNSFDLYDKLTGMALEESEIMISLDVQSLFTNVPIDLAIVGIEKRWDSIKEATKIPKTEFINAIKFILNSTYFTFNGTIYKQTFGTPMGSPLSPIIADIVMEDLEEKALCFINPRLSAYFRYVDDVFLIASKDTVPQILKMFNEQHDRLKFTIEYEENH